MCWCNGDWIFCVNVYWIEVFDWVDDYYVVVLIVYDFYFEFFLIDNWFFNEDFGDWGEIEFMVNECIEFVVVVGNGWIVFF